MNLRHLAVFNAVADSGSISKAAEALHISQPAVSREVKTLEESIGVALLDRLPRGIRLTEAGVILAQHARRLFALEQHIESLFEDIRALRLGRLALGASTTIGNYLLPPILANFQKTHRDIEISLAIGNTETIQQHLLDQKIDIGFTEGFAESDEFEVDVFMEDELVVISPVDHPLSKIGPVGIKRLCKEPCVMREPGSGTRAVLEKILVEKRMEPHRNMVLGSPEAVKRAVMSGAGIAVASYFTIKPELDAGLLARIPLSEPGFRRSLHQLKLRNRTLGPAYAPFLAMLAMTVCKLNVPACEPTISADEV